jgi:hypothetical protein
LAWTGPERMAHAAAASAAVPMQALALRAGKFVFI